MTATVHHLLRPARAAPTPVPARSRSAAARAAHPAGGEAGAEGDAAARGGAPASGAGSGAGVVGDAAARRDLPPPTRTTHPAGAGAGAAGRRDLPIRRLAGRLAARGARHPQLAAAILACRGQWVLDQHAFAALLGIPVHHIRSLEAGHRPATHAPRRLAELDPTVDWTAAGLTQRGDPTDRASRHPAAGAHRREHAPP